MKTNWMFCLLLTTLLTACGSDSKPKDTDADSIADKDDNCVNMANLDQLDLDQDGMGDVCDDDIDGDGALNTNDAFPRDIEEYLDTDGDLIGDNADNCPTIANADQLNTDNDSAGDACDDLPTDPSDTKDFDGDLIGDTLDPDDDNDTYNDDEDAFPFDATEWADVDGDNVGDNKDLHLSNTSQNAAQLQRLLEEGKATRFISPGPESDRFGDHFGRRVTNAGDVNNDGFDDLLIGFAAYEDDGQRYGGLVILLFGREQGLPDTVDFRDIENTDLNYLFIHGGNETDFGYGIGNDVASVGDMNKDNYDDFIIGASRKDHEATASAGEAYLVFGREAFPKNHMTIDEIKQDHAITYFGKEEFGVMGSMVEGIGDVNHDTYPDFMIGEFQHDLTPDGDEGRSILIFGGPHLVPPTNSTPINIDPDTLDATKAVFIHNTPLYLRGSNASIIGLGDINADGIDDVAIARRHSNNYDGQVTVILGREAPWPSIIDLDSLSVNDGFQIISVSSEDQISHQFGHNLAKGDMNGDGHNDMVISSLTASDDLEDFDENRIYIVYGGRQAWPTQLVLNEMAMDVGTYIQSDARIDFGYSIATLPDTNGDGTDELLASSPKDYIPGVFYSKIYRLNGRENWDNLVVSKLDEPMGYEFIENPRNTVGFGQNIAVVGDYNQDGLAEYVIDDLFTVDVYEGQPTSEELTHFYMVYGTSSHSQLDGVTP